MNSSVVPPASAGEALEMLQSAMGTWPRPIRPR